MRKLAEKTFGFLKKHIRAIEIFVSIIIALLVAFLIYNLLLVDRIVPNVYVAGENVGFLAPSEAEEKVKLEVPESLVLRHDEVDYELKLDEVGFEYDYKQTIDNAYSIGRTGSTWSDLVRKMKSIYEPSSVVYSLKINEGMMDEYLSVIAGQIVEEPVLPSVSKVGTKMIINPGSPGTLVDLENIKDSVISKLESGDFGSLDISTTSTPQLSESEVVEIQKQADLLIDKKLVAKLDKESIEFSDEQLAQSLLPQNQVGFLVNQIKEKINRPPQNAILAFEGDKVKEFTPALDGLEVVESDMENAITKSINQLTTSDVSVLEIIIPVRTTLPEVTNDSVNNLGISKLLGRGSSQFAGSIASRIHNIGVASASFNGVLIKPGEVFSFNSIVGDISALTGYQQAYVIKDGATVLGDGGGVCQVSTTLFRAALDAGLPIVERKPHSYRVAYYEQNSPPGLDATIYSPTTDLKIKNDTPSHLLIQTLYDPTLKTLDFEIYGTPDGRKSTITEPVVTSVSAPPEDLYIDDPNLKVGEVKQIDWKSWGAKVQFSYKVERGGEVIFETTYHSNYRPWQAKFLRGTAPI